MLAGIAPVLFICLFPGRFRVSPYSSRVIRGTSRFSSFSARTGL